MSFPDYWTLIAKNPAVFFMSILILGVIFVNGWTDAPNAITTCVSTGALSLRRAALFAAVSNLLGILIMSAWGQRIALTIYDLAEFGSDRAQAALALSAALFAIILWATLACRFGLPTSESHALVAGLTGASVAIHGSFSGIHGDQWKKILLGLLFSALLGFLAGFFFSRRIARLHLSPTFLRRAQVFGAGAMAFMHGAQDGQKFMGVFLLGVTLCQGGTEASFAVPFWLMLLCCVLMSLGTLLGGGRIVKTIGSDMVQLTPSQGFAADLGAAIALLPVSLFGMPVSTTHTKTTAILGAGVARGAKKVNFSVVRNLLLAWTLTFPACGILSFLFVRFFLQFI